MLRNATLILCLPDHLSSAKHGPFVAFSRTILYSFESSTKFLSNGRPPQAQKHVFGSFTACIIAFNFTASDGDNQAKEIGDPFPNIDDPRF
jgi:hypothetical protein